MSACLFARVRVVAIIVAPTAFAIWNAAIPTLLDAAVTMTKSPAVGLACSIRAPHAVTYCIQDAAACSNEMLSGCLTRLRAGTLANSPYVPHRAISVGGIKLTASPFLKPVADVPTALTIPAASYPRRLGK